MYGSIFFRGFTLVSISGKSLFINKLGTNKDITLSQTLCTLVSSVYLKMYSDNDNTFGIY